MNPDLEEPLIIPAHKERVSQLDERVSVKWTDFGRYVTKWDVFLMIIGVIASFANGWALPMFSFIFGDLTNDIRTHFDDLMWIGRKYAYNFLIVGAISWVLSYISMATWMIVGEKQAIRFRIAYFRALLRQQISWYDEHNPNEISTKIANDCFAIQAAISEKVSTFTFTLGNAVGGFTIAILNGWKMALILAAVIIVPMMIAGSCMIRAIQKFTSASAKAYETAGGYAEQALTGIRTVRSLNGEELELENYSMNLDSVKRVCRKYGIIAGISMAFIFFVLFTSYAIGLWYGSKLVEDESSGYDTGKVLTIFLSLTNGMFSFGQITPCLKAFSIGKEALARVLALIQKKPEIDVYEEKGETIENCEGNIVFNEVSFSYPSRPKEKALSEFTAAFLANKKTALVGESGGGKSTCMQLIERFYDVENGSITLDGHNLRDLKLRWLRNNIGYVGQEPVLFATTIRENLLFSKEDATEEELIEATKKARAYEFITQLEKGFDTFVGSGGAQLSGGQKQRLAIARVILKNPKILLLDEATSALDRKNEKEIQNTLNTVAEGKTTIIIAHRLSTVKDADNIIVMEKGTMIDQGKHNELFERNSLYNKMATHQMGFKGGDLQKEESEETLDSLVVHQIPSQGINGDESPYSSELFPKNKEAERSNEDEKNKVNIFKIFFRLLRYNKKGILPFIVMIIFSGLTGAIFPCFALLYAQMLDTLNNPDAKDFRSRANFISLMFVVIAIAILVTLGIQTAMGNLIGESMTKLMRIDIYKKMLRMDMEWFDKPENTPGTLMTRLAADPALVNSLVSNVLTIVVQSLGSLLTGVVISFFASWQVTMVTLPTVPLTLIAGYFQQEYQSGYSANSEGIYKNSGGFITEMIVNIKTVASFGREPNLVQRYENLLEKPMAESRWRGNKAGFIFGLSQFLIFGVFALSFYLGIYYLNKGDIEFLDMYTSVFALVFAAYGSGAAFQYMIDLGAAKEAGREIFEILDYQISITNQQNPIRKPFTGEIEFRDVCFKYPSRNGVVLENLSFKIEPNQKIAFVGPSGCGKSTIFQLLLRFYDIQSGSILIDGVDIREYDLQHLRKQLAIVFQEPVLFNGTIESNIKYNNKELTLSEVKEAASYANALKFIENNQFECVGKENVDYGIGFNRVVGPRGSQLSGGQKQRIAIARAIIRRPMLYLFDEPTSALDSQNEEIIQESLDHLMQKSTSITIAHRISTVKNCDKIFVLLHGKLVEEGGYEELLKKQGIFYKLERGLQVS